MLYLLHQIKKERKNKKTHNLLAKHVRKTQNLKKSSLRIKNARDLCEHWHLDTLNYF